MPITINGENLLTSEETAARLGWTPGTMAFNRAKRRGPPVIKIGQRRLYREASLLAWMLKREVDIEAPRRRAVGE